MKKTLAAVAVLGAFAGSALAADVTLYGKVDLGVHYLNSDAYNKDLGKNVKADNWDLKSGGSSSSRWGIKGSEQISEGLTVGFQLESGFDADTGDDQDDLMFRRESRLYVATDYGTLHMGRFGALDSATGSVDMTAGMSASGTGYGSYVANHGLVMKTHSRNNNSIAYTAPTFAGVKVTAMASLGDTNGANKEGSSDVKRYYGIGATGQWGAFGAGLVVSSEDWAHVKGVETDDNSMNVTGGVNYDFGVAKVYVAANYYDSGKEDVDQWGTTVSVAAPVAGGSLEVSAGYGVQNSLEGKTEVETDVMYVGGFYKYPLSKRTYVYAAAGYAQEDADNRADKNKYVEAMSGICHNF